MNCCLVLMLCALDMLHHDCYYDGCSFGSVLCGLWCIPRHSGAAQSTQVLPTVARLCCDSDDFAHLSVSVLCWRSCCSLLGSVNVFTIVIISSLKTSVIKLDFFCEKF